MRFCGGLLRRSGLLRNGLNILLEEPLEKVTEPEFAAFPEPFDGVHGHIVCDDSGYSGHDEAAEEQRAEHRPAHSEKCLACVDCGLIPSLAASVLDSLPELLE